MLSGNWGWTGLQIVLAGFPVGLCYLLNAEADWLMWIPYGVYVGLGIAATILRRRILLFAFVVRIVLNVGGCHKMIHDLSQLGAP
jgi:hypothetical protein